jgi:FG-GAP-like repeat/FG-GAP repeat
MDDDERETCLRQHECHLWLSDGLFTHTFTYGFISPTPDLNWEIGAVGDFDGDGHPDIAWRHRSTGANAIWFMNGSDVLQSRSLPAVGDLGWEMAGSGDFNRDGHDDILWRHRPTGLNSVWLMNGATVTQTPLIASMPAEWRVAAVADYDRNGSPDIVWQRTSNGQLFIWLMDGLTAVDWHYITSNPPPDPSWKPVGPR